jgi:hypothetical protein
MLFSTNKMLFQSRILAVKNYVEDVDDANLIALVSIKCEGEVLTSSIVILTMITYSSV